MCLKSSVTNTVIDQTFTVVREVKYIECNLESTQLQI